MALSLQVKIGRATARLRREKKLSQEDLADKAKLHRTYISKMEQGRINIGARAIEQVARAFRLSVTEFIAEAEKERGS